MPKPHKLRVYKTLNRPDLSLTSNRITQLPLVAKIPGTDRNAGLIELEDGSLRRILKLDGFSADYCEEYHSKIAENFQKVLRCIDRAIHLQFVVKNTPIDAEHYLSSFDKLCTKDVDYLTWYADYTKKWFQRVCNQQNIPSKEFYVVVSLDRAKSRSKDRASRIAKLDRITAKVASLLEQAELSFEILSRSEVRKLLFSFMRPSYITGLSEEPAEINNTSSLPRLDALLRDSTLNVDGVSIATQVLSDLPANPKQGWLTLLLALPFPLTVSLHFKKSSTRAKKDDLLEMSCYLSTFESLGKTSAGPSEGYDLNKRVAATRAQFARCNALMASSCEQFSAWVSTLPLGVDSGGIAHAISLEDAGRFCPLFTESIGSGSGFPLGSARYSNEPVFLCPSSESNVVALTSSESDAHFFNSFMATRMLSMNFNILYMEDGSNGLSVLEQALGANIVNDLRSGGTVLDPCAVLTIYSLNRLLTNNKPDEAWLRAWTSMYSRSARALAIFVSDLKFFKNKETLQQFYNFTKSNNITVVTSVNTANLRRDYSLEFVRSRSTIEFIFPQNQRNVDFVVQYLALGKGEELSTKNLKLNEFDDLTFNCFLRTSNNRGAINILTSPMDFYMVHPYTPSRKQKLVEFKEKLIAERPKVSQTDVMRQALYYLGLKHDDS